MAKTDAYSCEHGQRLDPAEREKLIIDHLPLVHWVASRLHERLPASIPLEDLVSTGIVGLIAAVDNFDPRYNVKLCTYARHRVRGAILDSIRGLDGISGPKRQRIRNVQAAITALEQRLQRAPKEEEIAAQLGISLQEYQQWLGELQAVSIEVMGPSGDGEWGELLNAVASNEAEQPGQILERTELERVLQEGIERLPKREGLVLSLYYNEDLTLREIASIMDLHLTRIAQLKAEGILRLRAYLERYWPMRQGVHR